MKRVGLSPDCPNELNVCIFKLSLKLVHGPVVAGMVSKSRCV